MAEQVLVRARDVEEACLPILFRAESQQRHPSGATEEQPLGQDSGRLRGSLDPTFEIDVMRDAGQVMNRRSWFYCDQRNGHPAI